MFVPFIVDEGDTISLENLKKIGGNTSSHMLLSAVDSSRRHELPWISLEAQLPILPMCHFPELKPENLLIVLVIMA